MATIGKINSLLIIKRQPQGLYLDGEDWGEILLPNRDCPKQAKIGDKLDVFLYHDSESRIVATTLTPKVMLGEVAVLDIIDINAVGAFLDWGLAKDLLLPQDEQTRRLTIGHKIAVYVFQDEQSRLVASMKLRDFMTETNVYYQEQQAVELLIADKTNLGYRAVINGNCLGMLYHNEIFQKIQSGDQLSGYIKKIRDDQKIDLCLQLVNSETRQTLAEQILAHLEAHNGVSDITDKSSPDDIYAVYQVSKSNYKKALGHLYKRRMISLSKTEIKRLK